MEYYYLFIHMICIFFFSLLFLLFIFGVSLTACLLADFVRCVNYFTRLSLSAHTQTVCIEHGFRTQRINICNISCGRAWSTLLKKNIIIS